MAGVDRRAGPARADLHLHTTASDGARSPAEVVRMAAAAGLAAIAIADHDTIDGIEEAELAAASLARDGRELRVVPAVEINTDLGPVEVHVLGYFIDRRHREFGELLLRQREMRVWRARQMVARLAALGMPVRWEDVQAIAGRATLTRPHLAAALVQAGHVRDISHAMRGVLARGGPAYVTRDKLTPHQAVVAIRQAGGAAVLAHPGTIGQDRLIDELVLQGLVGLEVRHPLHTVAQERHYSRLARRRGLVMTGGTDYHGLAGAGKGESGQEAPPRQAEDWRGYGHSVTTSGPGEVWVPVQVVDELWARRGDGAGVGAGYSG